VSDRTKKYLDGLERTVKTFAQAMAAALLALGFDDWALALELSAYAGLAAVLTSIAGWKIGNNATSSVLPASADPATPPGQGS
jgi:hypothetical protein